MHGAYARFGILLGGSPMVGHICQGACRDRSAEITLLDLPAERRLSDVQLCASTCEIALVSDSYKMAELMEIHFDTLEVCNSDRNDLGFPAARLVYPANTKQSGARRSMARQARIGTIIVDWPTFRPHVLAMERWLNRSRQFFSLPQTRHPTSPDRSCLWREAILVKRQLA